MSELLGAIGKDPGMTNPLWPVFHIASITDILLTSFFNKYNKR